MSAMMLRRRTERKAKVAASCLFKRVASGQDWNPSSPSAYIPAKRTSPKTSPKSKTAVASSAKVAKSSTSSGKVAVDLPKRETSRTQQKFGVLPKKGGAKVPEKSDTIHKRGAAKLPQKTGNSHKKRVEVTPKQVRSVKQMDAKTQVKTSASPKKEVAKVLSKLGVSPKKESVAGTVKAVVSPKKEDSLAPQKSCTAPKKEDGKLPQKLVMSPKKVEVESLQKTDLKNAPDGGKTENTWCGDEPDNCVKKKVTGRSENEKSREPKTDPNVVTSASPQKLETSPVKVAVDRETESGSACNARKRKLEKPEVESLMTIENDVCVKLMKCDEKLTTVNDQMSERVESLDTDQTPDDETQKEDLSPPLNTQITHEQISRDTIAYPSDCFPPINFLAMIGLVPKSDIKKLEGSPNKLHREAGGKLRRILKPRLMPGMVYRKVTITKGLSLAGIVIDHHVKPAVKSVATVPSAMTNAGQLKPKVSNFSAVTTKFTMLRKDGPPLLASPKLPRTRTPPKLEVEPVVPLEPKPEDSSASVVDGVEEKKMEEATAPPGDETAKETEVMELEKVEVIQSPAKQKCVTKKKTECSPIKPSAVQNITSDLEPMARRSARQQGNRRRVWGHLLRANPDEFEEKNKWDTGSKDAPRILPKTQSLEDGAKKPTENTTNDDLTVVDVVGSLAHENTVNEECAGKPVQDAVACEAEGSLEPDSSRAESSITGPMEEESDELPQCSSQSASEGKSSPGKKPAEPTTTGKRRKKVAKDGAGKSPKTSKTSLSLADKTKAMQKTEDEIRVVSKSRVESEVKSLDATIAFTNYSFLSYRYKDADCHTPHMCSVCWVNDHMYCRNMKRTTSDLPPFGGCIHYVPCAHYYPLTTSPAKRSSSEHGRMNFVFVDRSEGSSVIERSWNDDDLICREEMIDSDSESRSPISPRGTEILGIQLKSRAEQIIRSLGIERMPESLDLRGGAQVEYLRDLEKVEEKEDDCNVVVEDYGAELCVDDVAEADDVEEVKIEMRMDGLDGAVSSSKLFSFEEHDSGFIVNGRIEDVSRMCADSCDTSAESVVCGVPKELASRMMSSNLCVFRVQVQKLDSDRVRVTYPKILEGHTPGEDCGVGCFVQKEVKFPTGADEKTLNEFLAQEALRLANEAPLEGGQRKTTMGVKKTMKCLEQKQGKGTKRSAATTAATTANHSSPSVMGKSRKTGKGAEHGCLDQASLARKEGLALHPRKRSRKLQSNPVLPVAPSGIAGLELCGRDVSASGAALPIEMERLPAMVAAGMESSAVVTLGQEFPLPGKTSQVTLEDEVGLSDRDLTSMDLAWSCGGGATIPDLATFDSSSTSSSSDSIFRTILTNHKTPSLVQPVDFVAQTEIPDDGLTSKRNALSSEGQEGQSASAYHAQAIDVNLDQGSLFAANINDQDIRISNRIVNYDPMTSVSPLLSDVGTSTVVFHPYTCIDSRPIPVHHEKDLKQSSSIVRILQQPNSASSSSQPIVNTPSSSKGASASTVSVPAKASLAPLPGPRAILPSNPSLGRSQSYNPVVSVSAAHSSLTGVVPGAITRATGLVIPLGYATLPGSFVSVTGRLPPQLTHLPISTAVCNSRPIRPNCVELTNVALANMAFSNAALTSITLASNLPVKVAMGCTTAPENLTFANVAPTNLTSAGLASMNVLLKNVACPNLASTNVACGNSSSLRKALSMTSVNMTQSSMASVGVVPVSMTPVSVTPLSMTSSVANVTCGNTVICMQPAGVGPPAMKIARLDHILTGNHGPPLLIAQTRSAMPNANVSNHPSHADNHKTQSFVTTVQSPPLNVTKHCITSPLTLDGAPTGDILQMAWNQCNDNCGGPASCKAGSGGNTVCAVSSASNVSPVFVSVVDGSDVVLQ